MPIFIPCLFQLVRSQEAFTLHLGAVHEYYQTEERRRIKKIQNGTNLLVSLSFIGMPQQYQHIGPYHLLH